MSVFDSKHTVNFKFDVALMEEIQKIVENRKVTTQQVFVTVTKGRYKGSIGKAYYFWTGISASGKLSTSPPYFAVMYGQTRKEYKCHIKYDLEFCMDGSIPESMIKFVDNKVIDDLETKAVDRIGTQLNIGDRVLYIHESGGRYNRANLEFGTILGFKSSGETVKVLITFEDLLLTREVGVLASKCVKIDSDISDNLFTWFLTNGVK